MRKAPIVLLLLAAGWPAMAQMPWAPDLEAAQAQAQATGKLIMVDFYTDW
jgi:thiol:disulfide interchange protein